MLGSEAAHYDSTHENMRDTMHGRMRETTTYGSTCNESKQLRQSTRQRHVDVIMPLHEGMARTGQRRNDVMTSMSEEIRLKRSIWRCKEMQRLLAELRQHLEVSKSGRNNDVMSVNLGHTVLRDLRLNVSYVRYSSLE